MTAAEYREAQRDQALAQMNDSWLRTLRTLADAPCVLPSSGKTTNMTIAGLVEVAKAGGCNANMSGHRANLYQITDAGRALLAA